MNIVIVGAGVQGTVFAVRLALAGHHVTLISRGARAAELRQSGATIQNAQTSRIWTKAVTILEKLPADCSADMCLVTVRREQIDAVLPDLAAAVAIKRVVFLGNYVYWPDRLRALLGESRTVLAFPGIAGYRELAAIRYVDVAQQHTVVETRAPEVAALFREAGFRVEGIEDMDAWLQRHAVFITAVVGALYECDCDAGLLAQNAVVVRRLIVGVREGWAAQDRKKVASAPWALRTIMCWVPLRFSAIYWSRLLASPCGDLYFARHARHAPAEMALLADDIRVPLSGNDAPNLRELLGSIDAWQLKSK